MKSRPVFLRAMRQRKLLLQPTFLPRPALLPQFRPLSSTRSLLNESSQSSQSQSKQKQSEQKQDPPPEDNAPPQSPWRAFINTLKEEIEKNQAWQDNIRHLQGSVDKAQDGAAMRRAKALYERTRIINMIKENPRLQQAAKDLSKAGISVSEATAQALKDRGVIDALERLTNLGRRFAQPLVDSTVGKALIEALDDLGLQGYEDKAVRRARRQRRLERAGLVRKPRTKENPDAGEALVATEEKPSTSRFHFIKSSSSYQRFMDNYHESEEPLFSALRSVGSRVGRLFDENDTARVIRAIRESDPDFKMESFLIELKEYIVPEIVDAYLSADKDELRQWMSEAPYTVTWTILGEYVKRGLVSDCRVLEISQVDVISSGFANETVPVFAIICEVQQVNCWRSAKTKQPAVGSPDKIERCRYVFEMTRDAAELENDLTGGWKVVNMVNRTV